MWSSMFIAQLTTLWNLSINWLAGLDKNIVVNTREYIRLTDLLDNIKMDLMETSYDEETLIEMSTIIPIDELC
jgi:hypothetical protein